MRFVTGLFKHHVWAIAVVLSLLGLLLVWRWSSVFGLVAMFAAALYVVFQILRKRDESDRQTIQGLAAFLSTFAFILAGYWFFVERRSVPKLNVQPVIQTWPIGKGQAFARVELLLENVGTTDITLEPGDPVTLEIGQVLPLTGKQARELQGAYRPLEAGAPPLSILMTDKYPSRAVLAAGSGGGEFDLKIEAGETERRYFKAIVPCVDGLVSSVRVEVPKKLDLLQWLLEADKRQHFWRGQSISEMIVDCNAGSPKDA